MHHVSSYDIFGTPYVEHMQPFLLWLNMHVASIERLNVPPRMASNLEILKSAKTFA